MECQLTSTFTTGLTSGAINLSTIVFSCGRCRVKHRDCWTSQATSSVVLTTASFRFNKHVLHSLIVPPGEVLKPYWCRTMPPNALSTFHICATAMKDEVTVHQHSSSIHVRTLINMQFPELRMGEIGYACSSRGMHKLNPRCQMKWLRYRVRASFRQSGSIISIWLMYSREDKNQVKTEENLGLHLENPTVRYCGGDDGLLLLIVYGE